MEENRKIEDVRNIRTGEELKASEIFSKSEREIFKLRRQLEESFKKNEPLLVCSHCNYFLKIRGGNNYQQKVHFWHIKDSPDCPIKTPHLFSKKQINSMKYKGAKESHLHYQLKNKIAECLESDSLFSKIDVEDIYKSKNKNKKWKRPDVKAFFKNKEIVFEMQLSTTFLSDIVDREIFYFDNGVYIFWLFNSFNPDKIRFTEKDIFYENKSNAFIINEFTIDKSLKEKKFHLYCYYPDYETVTGEYYWKNELVTFNDLKFDNKTFKVYYKDWEENKRTNIDDSIRKTFEDFIINRPLDKPIDKETAIDLTKRLFNEGIIFDYSDIKLRICLDFLYSIKHRKFIHNNFNSITALANNFLEHYPAYTKFFLWALVAYGQDEVLKKRKSFMNKIEQFKKSKPKQDKNAEKLFFFLFPEVKKTTNL